MGYRLAHADPFFDDLDAPPQHPPVTGAQSPGAEPRIVDLTAHSNRSVRAGVRDPTRVYALVLHQMACCATRRNPLTDYLSTGAHFAIMRDGTILYLHPPSALIWASHGLSPRSVAVEFAGNFPNEAGRWWQGTKYGQDRVTPAQIEAGRHLVRHLIRTIGLTHVLAHRQSADSRENDPGPDIWYNVGEWAIRNYGLSDGGPGFKTGDGRPIPETWRRGGSNQGQGAAPLPAVRSSPPAAATSKRCQPARCADKRPELLRIKALVPLLESQRGDIPLELLLGWISVESGGCLGVVTSLCERGYFQIHPGESQGLGADHARLSADPAYSVAMGIRLVQAKAAAVQRLGFPRGTALFWRMAKLLHWLPRGVTTILRLMGSRPATWDELKSFALAPANRARILRELGQPAGSGWDPAVGIANVERTVKMGQTLARAVSTP